MSKPEDERESDQVFVLRCWRETRGDATDDGGWRVRISDVNLHRRRYVYGLEAAFQLIRRRLASAFTRSSREERTQMIDGPKS